MIFLGRSLLLGTSSLLVVASLVGCKEKETAAADAGIVTTTTAVDAGKPVDLSQCTGCQLAAQQAWSFQGIFKDEACTQPLAQTAPSACAVVPALGDTALSFGEDFGTRKTNETVNVTLVEQVAPTAPRFRKSGTKCVRADETATDLTPAGCAGQKVCRDANGALACTGCRTLSNGCPDYEETRMYASFNDTSKPTTTATAGSGNVARLKQCCAALATEAKRMGNAPEAGLLNTASAQCMAIANAVGPNGNAPELNAIKGLLAGRSIPAVCAGF